MKARFSSFLLIWVLFFCISCKDEPSVINIKTPDKGENNDSCQNEPLGYLESCFKEPNINTLDILTWNIEFFPQSGEVSINAVRDIINSSHADIIAVQEINDISKFVQLESELPGWEVQYFESGFLSLGFIYNTCEIIDVSNRKALQIGSSTPFPRDPVELTLTHKNGTKVTLINIHLKCCNDGEARRDEASILLKNYIDEAYPTENVLLVGDFNDDIKEGSPFENFIMDDENYLFTDMAIAYGPVSGYSYPSWPSHLDHILVTNELIDNIIDTQVLTINECLPNYYSTVSDHRPVSISLRADD